MSQHKTIADFGLSRGTTDPDIDAFRDAIIPLLGTLDDTTWIRRYVEDPNNEDMEIDYTLSLSLKTLIITSAFLEDNSANRHTDMRLWQLIVDGWVTEGGMIQPNTLRYLGCCSVINAPIGRAIKREINDQVNRGNAAPAQEIVTVGSDARTWRDNPFIRVGENVARALSALSGLTITVTRAHLIWLGHGQGSGAEDLSIVLELGSGSDAEDTLYQQATAASQGTLSRPSMSSDQNVSSRGNGLPNNSGNSNVQRPAGSNDNSRGQDASRCAVSLHGSIMRTAPTGLVRKPGAKSRVTQTQQHWPRKEPYMSFDLNMSWRV